MKEPPKAPPKETAEPSAFERMKEFTRRLVAVPKEELSAEKQRQEHGQPAK